VKEPVVIEEYNPRWPAMYEEAAREIREAIGAHIAAIEHTGSTAVPGLGAKPIIDILIGVRDLADADACIEPLEALGYQYVPEYEAEIPDRRYFRKGRPRTHHVHMVEIGGDFWVNQLLFRDYMRANPEAAREYFALKKRLAEQHRDDRDAYTEAKTQFVLGALGKARDNQTKRDG